MIRRRASHRADEGAPRAAPIPDPARLLHEQLAQAPPDLRRSTRTTSANASKSTDADAVRGAEHGRTSPDRTASRNGLRHRDLDPQVGTLDLAVPKPRMSTSAEI